MATQYTQQFKKDAVKYWKDHRELGIGKCAKNLGMSKSALSTWGKAYANNEGNVPTRGRGILKAMRQKKSQDLERNCVIRRMPLLY